MSIALAYDGVLELRDAIIQNTRVSSTGRYGVGMAVNANARASGERVLIRGNATAGLAVGSDPPELASIDFTDLVIADTQGDQLGDFGRGLEAAYGADASLERVFVRNSRLHGIFVDGEGSTITATDAFSLDTQPKVSDGTSGFGMLATDGSRLEVTRLLLLRNTMVAASFGDDGTQVVLRDVVVEETRPGIGVVGPCGRGLNAQEGVRLIVERARLSRNREVGIVIHDPTTLAILEDIVVEETATVGLGQFGSGIGAQLGAHLELTRAIVEDSGEAGIFVHDSGATAVLTDVLIRDGRGTPQFGTFGRGINVQTGASVSGTRVLLENNREAAILVANPGSSISLTDTTVRGTEERLCAATTCPNEGAGAGVLTGAQIIDGATIDLMDGDVVNHPVGVNVQTVGFDDNRVLTDVRYFNTRTSERRSSVRSERRSFFDTAMSGGD